MHRLRRMSITFLVAASLAGLPACGTEDAEREANEAGKKAEEAADEAKRKAEEAKRDAEKAKEDVDGQ
jgi:hypothetical protein